MNKYKIHLSFQGHARLNYNLRLRKKSNSEKQIQKHSHTHSMNICFKKNSAEIFFFEIQQLFSLYFTFPGKPKQVNV